MQIGENLVFLAARVRHQNFRRGGLLKLKVNGKQENCFNSILQNFIIISINQNINNLIYSANSSIGRWKLIQFNSMRVKANNWNYKSEEAVYQNIESNMSQFPYHTCLPTIVADGALRRPTLAVSRAAESVFLRSKLEAQITAENAQRRPRLQAQFAASRAATEAALRRSRVAVEVEAERLEGENKGSQLQTAKVTGAGVLRPRAQVQVAGSGIQAQIQASRIRRLYYPYI